MKVAGIREVRAQAAALLGGTEPVLVTRHGKVSGLYLPLEEPDRLPEDLRHELIEVIGRHLSALLDSQGVTEEEVLEDFRAARRRDR
ncbi:MAG TPA: prevent-host-death protein [Thermoanaerobaculia bacterium]|jgi:hypothetical protein|nr:prevent-host-death protein [Thermoanaerobaculia bacterium]